MPSFSFNAIPINIKVPGQYIEVDNSKAYTGLSGIPTKVLAIGQMLAAGTANALEPTIVTTTDQAVALFGAGSQLAHMVEAYERANPDSLIEFHAIGQEDDDAAVAATGSLLLGGAVTASGTLSLYVANRRVRVTVASATSLSDIATALVAAIQADTNLPVSAAVNGGTPEQIDLTVKNKGVEGNYLDIRVNKFADEKLPAGLTVDITALSNGAGNPDVQDVLTAIGDEWYTDFIMAYTDTANIVVMEDELTNRFGPMQMIDGHCYIGLSNTHANLITHGGNRNNPHMTSIGAKGSPSAPYEWAAALAAQCAFHGKNDPARPFQTLALRGIAAPDITDRFTREERELLLNKGISTFRVDTGGVVVIERVITNYRENAFGAADPSYLDLNTLKTLTYLRYDTRTFIALKYPRYKLANDGTRFARGQNVVTPSVIRGSLISRFRMWEEIGLVEDFEQFQNDLIVERDAEDNNRVNALIPPNVVNQLRVFAGLLQPRL